MATAVSGALPPRKIPLAFHQAGHPPVRVSSVNGCGEPEVVERHLSTEIVVERYHSTEIGEGGGIRWYLVLYFSPHPSMKQKCRDLGEQSCVAPAPITYMPIIYLFFVPLFRRTWQRGTSQIAAQPSAARAHPLHTPATPPPHPPPNPTGQVRRPRDHASSSSRRRPHTM